MNLPRRTVLAALGVGVLLPLAGCSEALEPRREQEGFDSIPNPSGQLETNSSGDAIVIDQLVREDTELTFDATAGETYRITVLVQRGGGAVITVRAGEDETPVLDEVVDQAALNRGVGKQTSFEFSTPTDGTYSVILEVDDRIRIQLARLEAD